MRIGIDGSSLVKSQPTGVEKATTDLIRALIRLNIDHQLIIYTQTPLPEAFLVSPAVENRVVPQQPYWSQTALFKSAQEDNLDLFWSPSSILPLRLKCKTLSTVHDLAFVRFPQIYSTKARILSQLTVLIAKWKKAHFVAVSHTTKEDLVKYYRIPEDNITVIYNALDASWQQELENAPTQDLGSYILFASRIEERKNVENIIHAFKKVSGHFPNMKLVLVGNNQTPYARTMEKLVTELNLGTKVEFRGYVKSHELSPLFKNAKLFLYPSLYEGFGIPILEAFAAGSPVVTSRFGATKEIADEAAVLVNPHNVDDIARSVSTLLAEPELRQEYIQKGRDRLQLFSWEESAKKLLLTIEKL